MSTIDKARAALKEIISNTTGDKAVVFVSKDQPKTNLSPTVSPTPVDETPVSSFKPSGASPKITSEFGKERDVFNTGTKKKHMGTDIAASIGTPLYAVYDGVVETAKKSATGGNMVVIRSTDSTGIDHKIIFMHMDSISVNSGQDIKAGSPVGTVGSTGRSQGPHLHIEHVAGNNHIPASHSEIEKAFKQSVRAK